MLFDLTTLPAALQDKSVTSQITEIAGRRALCVQLTEDITLNGKPDVDYVDMPTFAVLPIDFKDGFISVDILSRLHEKAPDYARAFAGLAYRIADDFSTFEAVYLRPLNGLRLNPPPPRHVRAVQYFAFPDWRYERLRQEFPDGRYEAGADIIPNEWTNLRLEINGTCLAVYVNSQHALDISQTKAVPQFGKIGLFVDIGTQAFFSQLKAGAL